MAFLRLPNDTTTTARVGCCCCCCILMMSFVVATSVCAALAPILALLFVDEKHVAFALYPCYICFALRCVALLCTNAILCSNISKDARCICGSMHHEKDLFSLLNKSDLFCFVLFCFVSFRFVSFRFVSFRFVCIYLSIRQWIGCWHLNIITSSSAGERM